MPASVGPRRWRRGLGAALGSALTLSVEQKLWLAGPSRAFCGVGLHLLHCGVDVNKPQHDGRMYIVALITSQYRVS